MNETENGLVGDFSTAFAYLKRGCAIKRSTWLGYWKMDGENILMHCKDGTVVSMKDGCIPMFTLCETLNNDWMVLDEAHVEEFDKIHAAKILAPAADQQKAAKILASRS